MLYKLQFTRIRVIGQFHKVSKKYLKYLLSMSFVLDITKGTIILLLICY
jgi:hypothetical protein